MRPKYVYFGKNPTNVCFNGVSLPVYPGDVLKCHPDFIFSQIPEKQYKEVAPGSPADKRPIKHDLGRQPFFIKRDPMGGLPIRTNPDDGPHLADPKRPKAVSPALIDEIEVENPYEMPDGAEVNEALGGEADAEAEEVVQTPAGIPPSESLEEDPQVSISTVPELPSAPGAPEDPLVVGRDHYMKGPDFDLGDEDEDCPDCGGKMPEGAEECPDCSVDEEEEVDEEVSDDGPVVPPKVTTWGRTELRTKTRDDIFDVTQVIKSEGCPLQPEMLDTFNEFGGESTRGVMFQTIWEYLGFNS